MMKGKKRISIFLIIGVSSFLMTIAATVVSYFTPNAIPVYNETDLQNINNNLNGYYILKSNIEITKAFVPIGSADHPFTGTLVGTNYSIKNLFFDIDNDEQEYGLFNTNKGIIYGLSIELNANPITDITLNNLYFGTFAVNNYGKITNCCLNSKKNIHIIAKTISSGGVCCKNYGEIRKCLVSENLTVESVDGDCSYGVFANTIFTGIIEMCRSSGWPRSLCKEAGTAEFGGITANSYGGVIKNCYSFCNPLVKSNYKAYCSGVTCSAENIEIINCFSRSGNDSFLNQTEGDDEFVVSSFICAAGRNVKINNSVGFLKIYSLSKNIKSAYFCANYEEKPVYSNCYYLNEIDKKYNLSKEDSCSYLDKKLFNINYMGWDSSIWKIDWPEVGFVV